MLVSGGMEDVVGTEVGEDALHALFLTDAGDNGLHLDIGELLTHHQADIVLRGFGLVDEHHLGGSKLSNLADHLTTDAACGTGDKDALALEHLVKALHIDIDLVAWQQVVDAHLLELHLVNIRTLGIAFGHVDLHTCIGEHALQLLVVTELVVKLWRHQYGTDAETVEHIRQILHLIDTYTHEKMSIEITIVGDESTNMEVGGFLVTDGLS